MRETEATKSRRGLILGGGGVTGLSWEVGILYGLASGGIQLETADAVIGTSAGAFAAAGLLDAGGIRSAYDRQHQALVEEVPANFSPEIISIFTSVLRECAGDDEEAGRRLGALALNAKTIDAATRRAVVHARLGRDTWPSKRLQITAVDADSGELHLLNSKSGMSFIDAVSASGAAPCIWPVVHAEGKRWIDGGSVSVANAHLAANFAICIVISPMSMNFSGLLIEQQLDALSKTRSMLLVPDERSRDAIGNNPLDPDRRPAAAEAGYEQGYAAAAAAALLWN